MYFLAAFLFMFFMLLLGSPFYFAFFVYIINIEKHTYINKKKSHICFCVIISIDNI